METAELNYCLLSNRGKKTKYLSVSFLFATALMENSPVIGGMFFFWGYCENRSTFFFLNL